MKTGASAALRSTRRDGSVTPGREKPVIAWIPRRRTRGRSLPRSCSALLHRGLEHNPVESHPMGRSSPPDAHTQQQMARSLSAVNVPAIEAARRSPLLAGPRELRIGALLPAIDEHPALAGPVWFVAARSRLSPSPVSPVLWPNLKNAATVGPPPACLANVTLQDIAVTPGDGPVSSPRAALPPWTRTHSFTLRGTPS